MFPDILFKASFTVNSFNRTIILKYIYIYTQLLKNNALLDKY